MSAEIHQVVFRPDGLVEITYAEEHEQLRGIFMERTLALPSGLLEGELADLTAAAKELLDEALTCWRNEDAFNERVRRAQRSDDEE